MHEKLQWARTKLAIDLPYLCPIIYKMVPVERKGLGTIGVDLKMRLVYDPEFLDAIPNEAVTNLLRHEAYHIMRDHSARAKAKFGGDGYPDKETAARWNIAADFEINDDLKAEGIYLGEGAYYPDSYGYEEGLPAEAYWKLMDEDDDPPPLPENNPHGNDGAGEGKCGGCATGESDKQSDDEGIDGISEAEKEVAQRETAKEILKAQGVSPGLKKLAAELLDTSKPLNWKQLLRSKLKFIKRTKSGAHDYTYRRPSRRSHDEAIIKPGMQDYEPSIFVGLDTSGSMYGELELAISEVQAIIDAERIPIKAVCVDSQAYGEKTIKSVAQLDATGGGGTDMRVAFELGQKSKANIFILITDGYTPYPDKKPQGMDSIICITPRGTTNNAPSWATVVKMKTE